MTDCFALLDLPRQPWLEPEAVQARFIALSAVRHPDKLGDASEADRQAAAAGYAELNAAYQTLRDPKTRLSHLIELATGTPPPTLQAVSNASADLFFEVSSLCRQVDGFLAGRAQATSPLLKAGHFARGLEWTDRIQALQQRLATQRSALEQELNGMNPAWAGFNPDPTRTTPLAAAVSSSLPRLGAIYQSLGYLARWNAQLEERLVQLAT